MPLTILFSLISAQKNIAQGPIWRNFIRLSYFQASQSLGFLGKFSLSASILIVLPTTLILLGKLYTQLIIKQVP